MIELPEAAVLSRQIQNSLKGKKIISIEAGHSPHKFAWFYGDCDQYGNLAKNKIIERATSSGGFVEIFAEDVNLLFSEGASLRLIEPKGKIPLKHQLLIEFDDGTFLSSSVQMYGGMGCFPVNSLDNPIYLQAKEKPEPGSAGFSFEYFESDICKESLKDKSIKAVLATEQRIPGLGNGVLQDILYNAGVHPKRKLNTLDGNEQQRLYASIVETLSAMKESGGRNTEKDLFGNPGGYKTFCSKETVGTACQKCGEIIIKQAYMGGSIYFCPGCQKN